MTTAPEPAPQVKRIGPHPGAQTLFMSTPADIGVFGGAASGGKSYVALLEALRHIHRPLFRGVYFRRTAADLRKPKGLWDTSRLIYPHFGGRPREQELEWHFPSGAWIKMNHLEHDNSVYDHQGAEYPLCASVDTDVLMADGTYRRLGNIVVGDVVATLQGPRRVTRALAPEVKPCVRVSTASASIVVSEDHQMLHETHWGAPVVPTPTQCDGFGSTRASFRQQYQASRTLSACPLLGPQRGLRLGRRTAEGMAPQATDASSGDGRSGCGGCCGSHQARPQPQALSGRLVLAARAVHRSGQGKRRGCLHGVRACGTTATGAAQGSQLDCRGDRGCGGARPHEAQGAAAERTPSPACAGACTSCCSPSGGLGSTRSRSRVARFEYCHPYTKERQVALEDVLLSQAVLAPTGEQEVRDLTVEGASHWIARGGFVSRNCSFDEATHFSSTQFWYLQSRNRAPAEAGVRPYTRLTCNPDPDSYVMTELLDPGGYIDEEGYPREEMSGRVRWFVRDTHSDDDALRWGDSPEQLGEKYPHLFTALPPRVLCKSFTFVPARIDDNPSMGLEYKAQLMALPKVDRMRLLFGNWRIREAAGLMFREEFFPLVDVAPSSVRRVRFWDLAASKKKRSDHTAGVLMSVDERGLYCIEDIVELHLRPHGTEEEIARIAHADGHGTEVWVEQETGAGAEFVLDHFQRNVLRGFSVYGLAVRSLGSKVERAKPMSSAAEKQHIRVVRGPWNRGWFSQSQAFPDVSRDDKVDAASGAFNALQSSGFAVGTASW